MLAALDVGAVGYLLKDSKPEELRQGVRAAARDESPLSPKAARALLSERGGRRDGPQLSAREYEVLSLVGEGLANKVIRPDFARELLPVRHPH